MTKREIDRKLSGEIMKATWSMVWNYKKIMRSTISGRLKYPSEALSDAIKELVIIGAIKVDGRFLELHEDVTNV